MSEAAAHAQAHAQARVLRYLKKIKTLPATKVVKEIELGRDVASQAVVALPGTDRASNAYRKKLVDAGLVTVVLKFLARCENEKFLNVLSEIDEMADLAFPSVWVNLLLNAVARDNLPPRQLNEVRVQIASNIAPLVKCMSNDQKREFFQDNQSWHQTLVFFVALIQNLVLDPQTIPILLQYENLSNLMIQSLFWETRRPDIVQESKMYGNFIMGNSFAIIQSSASEVIQEMCDVETIPTKNILCITDEGRERLDMLAKTPIVSYDYDPDCQVAFEQGLIELLKAGGSERANTSQFYILQQFVVGNCVSKKCIAEMIQFGADFATSYNDAEGIVGVLHNFLIHTTSNATELQPDDDRFAFAIKAGLFEMCLHLLEQFGNNQCALMLDTMERLLHGASAVALLKKSSKAIAENKAKILPRIQCAAGRTCGRSSKLVSMIRSIVGMNTDGINTTDAYCRRCLTLLPKNKIKTCSKCQRAIYCSRECQVDDWQQGGHKKDCKDMRMSKLQVGQDGGGKRDMRRADVHEKNVSMAGNKVFSENVSSILMQAVVQNYNLENCVVMIDLCNAPPYIDVMLSSDFLTNEMSSDDENYEHTKRIVERNGENGAVTVACISLGVYHTHDNLGNPPRAILLKTFPGIAAPFGSWSAAQADLKRTMPFRLEDMHPEEIEELLIDLRCARVLE